MFVDQLFMKYFLFNISPIYTTSLLCQNIDTLLSRPQIDYPNTIISKHFEIFNIFLCWTVISLC